MLKEKNDDFEVVADAEFKLIENVVEELGDLYGEALIVAKSVQASAKAKLYNSGCTNHILPYKDSFKNFQVIETRHFRAANKQMFSTIGKGDLVIDIPSDNGTTQFRLQEVLYSPEVAYTLVSIGRLDEDGFLVTFGGGKCTIQDGNKEVVGVIQKTVTRVYKVEHEDMAGVAEEWLTLDSFHCCMGHISLETARKLVRDKMVTRVYAIWKAILLHLVCICQSDMEASGQDEGGRKGGSFWWGGSLQCLGASTSRVKGRKEILCYLYQ